MFRVANASGFYPDWFPAIEQQLTHGHVDVITGDYLAELTMGILAMTEARGYGYARNFVEQMRAGGLKLAMEQGVKIVVNAGGLQPERCARAVAEIAAEQGLSPRIAWVEGDDLRATFSDLQDAGKVTSEHDLSAPPVMTANAYFGCWPMVEAFKAGADVVVTGRCTDASPVMAAAAWHFGWRPDEFDKLAGALVAGHIIECGAQATGGNFAFLEDVPTFHEIGFPIAEFEADGSCVITKPDDTGGIVSVDTVKAQLFYEVGAQAYLNPDVTARLDTVRLEPVGRDRVRVSGTRGAAPPETLKVSCTAPAGFRHVVGLRTCGPNLERKRRILSEQVWEAVGGKARYDEWTEYAIGGGPASDSEAANLVDVYFGVKSRDPELAGRKFADALVQLALRSVPGITFVAPPGKGSPMAVHRAAFIPRDAATAIIRFTDGDEHIEVTHPDLGPAELPAPEALPAPASRRSGAVALADVLGARSGDKGGDANVGVWVRQAGDLDVLHAVDPAFIAEATAHPVERIEMYDLPNLLGRNFVLKGYLGDGVGASLKPDPQAKTLAEFIRAQSVTL